MKDKIIEKLQELCFFLDEHLEDDLKREHWDKRKRLYDELAQLKAEAEKEVSDEFHVWIIPVKDEIFVEDRGGGIPVGATEHIVFDTWEGALKLGQFLAKFCHYNLELDNEAGRFAETYLGD